MSILSELKKLTGKQNAKVVSEALPDEMGGSGDNSFRIAISQVPGPGSNFTKDKTYAEIIEAMDAGKQLIFNVSFNGNNYVVHDYIVVGNSGQSQCIDIYTYNADESDQSGKFINTYRFRINADDSMVFRYIAIKSAT